jgi:hypothetical protein
MKRFHVHVHVNDLGKNIAFYSAMFNQQPARTEADYAKWMLEDPPVNFAISTRGTDTGVDHLGIQVDSKEQLAEIRGHAARADMAILDEGETTCCYARSDKYWVTDPQGVAWEQFHTLDSIKVFNTPRAQSGMCCATSASKEPAPATASLAPKAEPAKSCC